MKTISDEQRDLLEEKIFDSLARQCKKLVASEQIEVPMPTLVLLINRIIGMCERSQSIVEAKNMQDIKERRLRKYLAMRAQLAELNSQDETGSFHAGVVGIYNLELIQDIHEPIINALDSAISSLKMLRHKRSKGRPEADLFKEASIASCCGAVLRTASMKSGGPVRMKNARHFVYLLLRSLPQEAFEFFSISGFDFSKRTIENTFYRTRKDWKKIKRKRMLELSIGKAGFRQFEKDITFLGLARIS